MTPLFDLLSGRGTPRRRPDSNTGARFRTHSRRHGVRAMTLSVFAAALAGTLACRKDNSKTAFESNSARPDVLPTMLNKDLPFRYPPALYAEKAQGNVTLRLFVDTNGTVVDDSTRIVESSNVPLLDSAAVRGSRDLQFVPAKLHGAPMAVSLLFPVYFRHPEAPPPAGDTILHKVPVGQTGKTDSTAAASPKSSAKKKSSH